jgi:hypothetical protein
MPGPKKNAHGLLVFSLFHFITEAGDMVGQVSWQNWLRDARCFSPLHLSNLSRGPNVGQEGGVFQRLDEVCETNA